MLSSHFDSELPFLLVLKSVAIPLLKIGKKKKKKERKKKEIVSISGDKLRLSTLAVIWQK